ncbi:nitronate monooxygenase [Trichococcus sp. K1Tr]|uniref:nitronate monooxygenase n=1 Tax=Trichococcus sp. K1Tr TaxID=3020847 RepID=UPI00232FA607|nr:nitronate monooxygenase [Trichococcus sp. K1Tr]MDB6352997.1 nitronate monooxygenase [Trichococcus sp. K1Tr]
MSLKDLLGIEYPIFQGAMARIATAALAGPVSEAGGLGIIGSGGLTGDQLRAEIKKVKEMTDKPFGVNLMLMMHNIPELVDIIIEEGVKVVTTGAGNPAPYIDKLKAAGVKVIPVVPSVKLAKKMEAIGADAIIAEGMESGGHVGETSTMSLVPQVVSAVNIPVLGAGGVGDGRGVVAMYAFGAVGIQAGTIFLTAEECPVPPSFKQAVLDADDTATVVTGRKLGAPVRSIKNPMLAKYIEMENRNATRDELEELTLGSLSKAVYEGDMENGSVMAGQIAGMLHEIKPVKQIITDLFDEAEEVLKNLTIVY